MVSISAQFRTMPGTAAALGRSGVHSLIADRPKGRAGGQGLGFNGAQLLALAVGGCFSNDLRYCAEEMGVEIADLIVDVTLELAGSPLLTEGIVMSVSCTLSDGRDPIALIEAAKASCMVSNSLARGVPVRIVQTPEIA